MTLVDHLFIVLLFVVQPIYAAMEYRRFVADAKAGISLDRRRFYWHTLLMEWLFFAALVGWWLLAGRSLTALGFVAPGGPGFWVGLAVVAVTVGYLVFLLRWAGAASMEEKARQLKSLGHTVQFLPHTKRELRQFYGVSVTAGIVEEVVYRGFLLWYLSNLMPVWAAVAVSSIGFGLAHSYQGAGGALKAGLVGFALGALYVISGSLWLPILVHALLDALQGAALYRLVEGDGSRGTQMTQGNATSS